MAFFVKTISVPGSGRADEAPDGVAGRLELARRLLGDGVDAAVHVGMGGLVVVVHRVEHGPGALGGRGRVEVDEALAVRAPARAGGTPCGGSATSRAPDLDGRCHDRSASYPSRSRRSASSGPPLSTMRPSSITCTRSGCSSSRIRR